MESVLATLGTQDVRRVKIGVGRPATRDEVPDWVLTGVLGTRSGTLCPGVIERAADAALLGWPPATRGCRMGPRVDSAGAPCYKLFVYPSRPGRKGGRARDEGASWSLTSPSRARSSASRSSARRRGSSPS